MALVANLGYLSIQSIPEDDVPAKVSAEAPSSALKDHFSISLRSICVYVDKFEQTSLKNLKTFSSQLGLMMPLLLPLDLIAYVRMSGTSDGEIESHF